MPLIPLTSDAELVAACLGGDREAFRQIVERYQRLLCSLAYSATGLMSESEDVAQEAFVSAWQHLRDLREPEKLRPWLCGILRHKVGRLRRREGREPVRQAESLEVAHDVTANEESAPARVMNDEEQRILWHALAQVPELYREPLVLYYREHQSVEHVAGALDLTEDAVKQRLARGRRMLQERVLAFVEGALRRSTPGKAFTAAVLASVPALMPTSAKAAALGAAAAHGGTLAKSTGFAALLASFTGLATTLMALRTSLDQSRTPRERRAVVVAALGCFVGAMALLLVLWSLRQAAFHWWAQRGLIAIAFQILLVGIMVAWPIAMGRMLRWFRALRSTERRAHPECFLDARDQAGSPHGEYRSRWTLLGAPLVHFRFSSPDEGQGPVFGWIAGGDRAYGLVFAWGLWAVAPISVGAFAVGLLSVGTVSVGVVGLGAFAAGGLALGCATIGIKTFGWLSALGWSTAQSGGFGLARLAAEAPIAFAEQANNPAARAILADPHGEQNLMVLLTTIVLLSIVPTAAYAGAVRRRLGPRSRKRR